MGRVGSLTADPLRPAGSAAARLAVQRLERAASLGWPLGAADRALAVLTCTRLGTLTASQRGDDALAAALARSGEAEPEQEVPGRRGTGQRSGARRIAAVPKQRPAPSPARRPSLPRRAAHREAHSPPHKRGRVEGATAALEVQGLEWLVHDVPGGREAAESPFDLVAALDGVEPVRPAVTPTTRPTAAPVQVSVERPMLPHTHAAESQRELTMGPIAAHGAPPVAATVVAATAARPVAGHGHALQALVRAWEADPQDDEPRAQAEPRGSTPSRAAAPIFPPPTAVTAAVAPPVAAPHAAVAVPPHKADASPAAVTAPASPRAAVAAPPHAADTAHAAVSVPAALPAADTAPTTPPAPADSAPAAPPAAADTAPVVREARAVADVLTPAGRDELLGLGDELGRVLVAELRRYGIEVGA